MTGRAADDGAIDALLRRVLLPADRAWLPAVPRRAAVLAPLLRHQGRDHVVFVVRSASLRQHAGQIAFPGGVDDGDGEPLRCALREAEEEVGIAAGAVTVLGGVRPRLSSSGYRVHCFVGRVADGTDLRIDGSEIDRVLLVPLADLRDLGRWYDHSPPAPAGRPAYPPSPHFACGDDVIWGLTGRFTKDVVEALAPA